MTLHKSALCVFTVAACLMAGSAIASPLVFQGQNAALFPGANPSDTSAMMNSVPKPAASSNAAAALTGSALVIQSLQAQLSNKIYNDIFGSSASPNGSHVFSDGTVITWATDSKGNKTITEIKPDGTVIQLY